jgi:hypothetical protein
MVFLQATTIDLQWYVSIPVALGGLAWTFRNVQGAITNKYSKQAVDDKVEEFEKRTIACEKGNKEQGESLVAAIKLWREEVGELKIGISTLTEKTDKVLSKMDTMDAMIEDMSMFVAEIIELFGEEDKHVKELVNVFMSSILKFYQSVLASNLYKITPKLLVAMYEANAKPVRDYYEMLEPSFIEIFVPEAKEHGKLYIQAIINMIESKANTRRDSFKVQTLAFFKNQIYLVLNKRNEWKGKQSKTI